MKALVSFRRSDGSWDSLGASNRATIASVNIESIERLAIRCWPNLDFRLQFYTTEYWPGRAFEERTYIKGARSFT